MGAHGHDKKNEQEPTVAPLHWKEARKQPRVRPQWDPAELANQLLDKMQAEGRLHRRQR